MATAGPAPCVVVTDPAGDEESLPFTGVALPDPALDLREVRLASDKRDLTITVLVAPGSELPDTRTWSVSFTDGESGVYSAIAYQHVDGDAFSVFGPGSDLNQPFRGQVSGTIDTVRGRITIVVPLRQLDFTPAQRFLRYEASAAKSVGSNTGTGPQSTSTSGDRAEGLRAFSLSTGCARR